MHNLRAFIDECESAPRLNALSSFFASTAAGLSGAPSRRPKVDRRMLPDHETFRQFLNLHQQRQGPFDQHYLCSIPYRFEEECRLGCAILRYAQVERNQLAFYSLGTAEGTMARTISELGGGCLSSLSCSPNIENLRAFYAYGVPPYATFFHGPFHHLTPNLIRTTKHLRPFADGFDIILEDTTFQMYSPNREQQVKFVCQHLKPDGIFLFVEKFKQTDEQEYRRREHQKDFGFKARFFAYDDISAKQDRVLTRMNENEVTLSEMARVLNAQFLHSNVVWNSGNFYTIAASNSADSMNCFMDKLCKPALPDEYIYEDLPRRL
jgi:SAM-dependent methyltransferase